MEMMLPFLAVAATGAVLLLATLLLERADLVRRVLQAGDDESDSPRRDEQAAQGQRRFLAWISGAAVFVSLRAALGLFSGVGEVPYAVIGALAAELVQRGRRAAQARRTLRRIDYHLPNAMERVVMGVGAGLDVVPALREAGRDCDDPVSEAFREVVSLSEAGMPAAEAMQLVSERTQSFSLRHSLVHLGIAHAQGGEIVKPLKELSDATQAHFQESVDEEIARLPVKAVLPLVVTFAGLILCFVTVPLLQVGSITRRVAHAAHP